MTAKILNAKDMTPEELRELADKKEKQERIHITLLSKSEFANWYRKVQNILKGVWIDVTNDLPPMISDRYRVSMCVSWEDDQMCFPYYFGGYFGKMEKFVKIESTVKRYSVREDDRRYILYMLFLELPDYERKYGSGDTFIMSNYLADKYHRHPEVERKNNILKDLWEWEESLFNKQFLNLVDDMILPADRKTSLSKAYSQYCKKYERV